VRNRNLWLDRRKLECGNIFHQRKSLKGVGYDTSEIHRLLNSRREHVAGNRKFTTPSAFNPPKVFEMPQDEEMD